MRAIFLSFISGALFVAFCCLRVESLKHFLLLQSHHPRRSRSGENVRRVVLTAFRRRRCECDHVHISGIVTVEIQYSGQVINLDNGGSIDYWWSQGRVRLVHMHSENSQIAR